MNKKEIVFAVEKIISTINELEFSLKLKNDIIHFFNNFLKNTEWVNRFLISINRINCYLHQCQKKVLFCTSSDYYTVLREGYMLKKNFWNTVLIFTNNVLLDCYPREAFDIVVTVPHRFLIILWSLLLNVDVIHFRGWMHNYDLAGIISVLLSRKVVVESMDLPEFFAPIEVYSWLFGKEEAKDDFYGVKLICNYAKAFLINYSDNEVKCIEEKYFPSAKIISWHNYIVEEYCVPYKSIDYSSPYKLVWAGSIAPTSYPRYHYPAKGLFEMGIELSKQGCRIDFIIPPKFFDGLDRDKYLDFLYENRFNSNFNFLKGKPPMQIVHDLSYYHYGVFPLIIKKEQHTRLFKDAIPTKFCLYLEAGLPILVSSYMSYLASIVRDNNLGLVFEDNDIYQAISILNSINSKKYNEMRKNIINFRKVFSYTKEIKRLIRVYNECIK